MSEEGGYGVAADATESATQQSGIKLIPCALRDLYIRNSASSPSVRLDNPFGVFVNHV